MKIQSIVIFITCMITGSASGQDFFVLLHDSSSVKNQCYLTVCSDQLSTGLVKISDLKFDSSTINKSRIITLKSRGLSWDLLFFRFKVSTVGSDTLTYIFCYNPEFRKYYKIGGFQNNDYHEFFSCLKTKGIKLNKSYFEKEKISVEGIDIFCLLDFYRSKLKVTNKTITDTDRQRFKCLQHYYGTVIIY